MNYLPHCGSQQSGYGNGNGLDVWQSERPKDMANIKDLDVLIDKSILEFKNKDAKINDFINNNFYNYGTTVKNFNDLIIKDL